MTADNKIENFLTLLANAERQLAGFVLSMIPNFNDADEILQETKIRLWQQFDDYDPERSFDAWSRSIAYYLILSKRKTDQRRPVVYSTTLLNTLAAEFENRGEKISRRSEALSYCLGQLSMKSRKLLGYFYEGSMGNTAIAEAFGMKSTAVRKALSRIRQSLHGCISRRCKMEDGASG